ncbi:MAG: helix-turn-helix transcriptional regulator [Candidatus Thorarchaeota archaeon]
MPQKVVAQDDVLDIVMEDVQIHTMLSQNGTSIITFSANVTYVGAAIADHIDIRIDLREIEVLRSVIGGSSVPSSVIPQSNYAIIRVTPDTAFTPMTSQQVEIEFTSNMLQESLGVCDVRNICLGTAIFYVRPLNEFRDFTFKATLPQHGILDTETSPLYPTPTRNYTDGTSLVFLWEAGQILPGQERVFIIKYGTPNYEPVVTGGDINYIPFIVLAAVIGAVLVIAVQQLPGMIRSARVPRVLKEQGVTEHEEQVIQLLSSKGGSCSQRDIYDDLGMSQSLVSMVLTGLEQRGVIRRFREGRENVVHLVEE